jgi:hypothetical protein
MAAMDAINRCSICTQASPSGGVLARPTLSGRYQLPPIDWDLITLPTVDNEHAMNNRLTAEQVAVVLPIVVEQYPFYAPMIFALYTLGLRYCHVAATRSSKLGADGVIAIEESYDVSANVFSPVDQRKKAPPMIVLEPRTLALARRHRRYLTQRSHPASRPGSCSRPRREPGRSATTSSTMCGERCS